MRAGFLKSVLVSTLSSASRAIFMAFLSTRGVSGRSGWNRGVAGIVTSSFRGHVLNLRNIDRVTRRLVSGSILILAAMVVLPFLTDGGMLICSLVRISG